jgi:hypothetical protein
MKGLIQKFLNVEKQLSRVSEQGNKGSALSSLAAYKVAAYLPPATTPRRSLGEFSACPERLNRLGGRDDYS